MLFMAKVRDRAVRHLVCRSLAWGLVSLACERSWGLIMCLRFLLPSKQLWRKEQREREIGRWREEIFPRETVIKAGLPPSHSIDVETEAQSAPFTGPRSLSA